MPERAGAPRSLTLAAPAKINLYLEVLGRRADGYHQVWTVMQAVSLWDELRMSLREDGRIVLTCSDPSLPCDERNLVVKAALSLREKCGLRTGADIHLQKRIPAGGGLGGGSSDAAIALLGLSKLWSVRLPASELGELAEALGSDVPFFLRGGTALCEGRGEVVRPLECPHVFHYVLVMPSWPISTARVYGALGPLTLTSRRQGGKSVLEGLELGDVELLGRSLWNDLQAPAFRLDERLERVWLELEGLREKAGAKGVLLSGSGSSFFVLTSGRAEAIRARRVLESSLALPCAAVYSLAAWEHNLGLLRRRRARD